ncbi:hypothetical protein [uncultured Paracoccus sp.]|uniref:hypothetical protein n=1 Tax=uncultured Paracoccus sp. TaxID=189685 RepID=UPI0026102241|nr:hypothetical protein [uncultured Paracoccus sp.]
MVKPGGRPPQLAQLARLAELKSEMELKRLAALNRNVTAARQGIAAAEAVVAGCYAAAAPLSLAEARVASAEAGAAARRAEAARSDLAQMLPRFEQARQRAMREFGRAAALRGLAQKAGGD